MHIIANPLLISDRHERSKKTEGEGSVMRENIYTNVSDADGLDTGKGLGGGGVEGIETCGAIEDSCTEI